MPWNRFNVNETCRLGLACTEPLQPTHDLNQVRREIQKRISSLLRFFDLNMGIWAKQDLFDLVYCVIWIGLNMIQYVDWSPWGIFLFMSFWIVHSIQILGCCVCAAWYGYGVTIFGHGILIPFVFWAVSWGIGTFRNAGGWTSRQTWTFERLHCWTSMLGLKGPLEVALWNEKKHLSWRLNTAHSWQACSPASQLLYKLYIAITYSCLLCCGMSMLHREGSFPLSVSHRMLFS